MGTFTTFERASLERYLVMFGVGELKSYEAIDSGIENSNYFVTTSEYGEDQEYVLTIVEGFGFDDIPFFNQLTTHLSHYGLPVPAPKGTLDGMLMTIFCGKPTMLVQRFAGKHLSTPSALHCEAIGKALAEIHTVATARNLQRDNPYDSLWQSEALAAATDHFSAEDHAMLGEVTELYANLEELSLPKGIIHGDLFRDNALFSGDALTGVIDFYHACYDFFVLDIAICINDWCRNEQGLIEEEKQQALLRGYESERKLEPEELARLTDFQQVAAARFMLTRTQSGGEDSPLKDPKEFAPLLRSLYSP